ncbi:MAG: acetyl-CoA carboxylase carboxyltransferase subunit beta, partial [Gaiellaceae bacterium]
KCDHHMRIRARERLDALLDAGGRYEIGQEALPVDTLKFKDSKKYPDRLKDAMEATGETDALVVLSGSIMTLPVVVACFEFEFMGGSMGSVVGEVLTRAAELALEKRRPYVIVSASGGARMQEGILSLMQLPKTVCAVEDLRDAGGTLISVMAHPTTAGVLASFASLGDVLIAEPGALLSFTGPRVVQQTTREKLPDDFGLAEANFRHGHVDAIVPRTELRPTLGRLLRLFADGR